MSNPPERFFHRLTENPNSARILLEVTKRIEQGSNQRTVMGKVIEVLPLRPVRKCVVRPRRFGELVFKPQVGFEKSKP